MTWKKAKAAKIFYSYTFTSEDKILRTRLAKHLAPLERAGKITTWCDHEITPGEFWREEINKHIYTADIILLLISPDFILSDYGRSKEIQVALARHNWGEARAIPILLRPVLWEVSPIGGLQALPMNGRPVTLWRNRDAAFLDIAKSIHSLIKKGGWREEGNAHYDIERYNEALANYEQAIQLDSTDTSALVSMGFVLCRLHRYNEALAAYEQAIQLDSGDATAYLGRGNTRWIIGEYDDAMRDYQMVKLRTGEFPGPTTPGNVWSRSLNF